MSDGSEIPSTATTPGKPTLADDALPPVEVPTMTFVTQLFLIPLLIVSIIVAVWLSVTWLVNVGSDPEKYVADLENPGKGSWQSAASLADMLRNPRNDAMKRDASLCRKLSEALDKQIASGEMSDHAIKLRIFLCRTLGEFYRTDGLPVLIKAATTERDAKEVVVRRTAIEAIAVLADNTDPQRLLDEPDLLPALRNAALERTDSSEDESVRGDLRARAAFTLGVLGGDEALDVLDDVAGDGYPNARFNAAVGLARNGDERAIPVLVEMLDPENEDVTAGEEEETAIEWKRALVMVNALESIERLAEINSDADLSEVELAVRKLEDAELHNLIAGRIHTEAREVRQRLERR